MDVSTQIVKYSKKEWLERNALSRENLQDGRKNKLRSCPLADAPSCRKSMNDKRRCPSYFPFRDRQNGSSGIDLPQCPPDFGLHSSATFA